MKLALFLDFVISKLNPKPVIIAILSFGIKNKCPKCLLGTLRKKYINTRTPNTAYCYQCTRCKSLIK